MHMKHTKKKLGLCKSLVRHEIADAGKLPRRTHCFIITMWKDENAGELVKASIVWPGL